MTKRHLSVRNSRCDPEAVSILRMMCKIFYKDVASHQFCFGPHRFLLSEIRTRDRGRDAGRVQRARDADLRLLPVTVSLLVIERRSTMLKLQ